MKKSAISLAVAATFGLVAASAQAVTVTWKNQATATASYAGSDPNQQIGFLANTEFRVMTAAGAVSGGGQKSIVNSDITWSFNGAGVLTNIVGSDVAPLATAYGTPSHALPAHEGQGLWHNAPFLSVGFGFVGTAHGNVTISFASNDNFTIQIPVAEAHWNQGLFNLGADNGANPDGFGANGLGVTLNCTGALSGNILCNGEEVINANEDSLGFAGQTAQWRLGGTLTPAHVPIPAAVWLFGSGLLGLVGVARRRKTS